MGLFRAIASALARARLLWSIAAVTVLAVAAPLPAYACEEGFCACPLAGEATTAVSTTPVTVTFFGVSTLMFSAGDDRILVDGFFSRPRNWLFSPISSDQVRVEQGLGEDQAPVRAILTAHAHHDHALDLVTLADRARDAVIVGTPSVARLAVAGKVDRRRLCAPSDGDELVLGGFRVTVFNVDHGAGVPIIGDILHHPMPDPAPSGPLWWLRFRDDRNLSFLIEHGGRRFLVHPSAGERRYGGIDPAPEVVFVGLGRVGMIGAAEAGHYLESLTSEAQGPDPALVIPIHWDGFSTAPGEALEATPWPFDNVPEGLRRLCALAERQPTSRFVRLDEGAGLVWIDRDHYQLTGRTRALCAEGTVLTPQGTIGAAEREVG